jgi:AraC family transcriptional regulator
MNRISVIRDMKLVPLLPGAPSGKLFSPVSGLIVEKHTVGAIEIPEHVHSTYCLHLQTSSPVEMEWWSEGEHRKERTEPGSLILLSPGTSDRLRWTASSRRIVVSMEEAFMLRASQELERSGRPNFKNRWAFKDPQLRLLLTETAREMESGWSTGTLYNDLLGMSLAVALIRKYSGEAVAAGLVKGGMPKGRLKRVLDYITANNDRDLRLDDLAQVAEMSRFHFARLFRSSMGVTPYQYLMEQRLQQAKTLLRLGSRTVAEVAAETGFVNASHFSRIFRKHLGVTPTKWKNGS